MSIDDALIQCQKALRRAEKCRANGDHDTCRLELEAVQHYAEAAETMIGERAMEQAREGK